MKKMVVVLTAALALAVVAAGGVAEATGLFDHPGKGSPTVEREQEVKEALANRLAGAGASARVRGPRGPRGARGPKGAHGAKGAQGPAGTFAAVTAYRGATIPICGWEAGACSVQSATATCPPGTVVVSGAYAGAGIRVFISEPVPGGWFIGATNENSLASSFHATVLCGS